MNYKGVIFDLDGTILDSMSSWIDVDKIFLSENGIEHIPRDVDDMVKKLTFEESAEYFIERFNLNLSKKQVINRIEEIIAYKYANEIQLKPYVLEFLDELDSKNIPYCIATATYFSLAKSALERLDIFSRFEFVLTCTDVGKNKTFPDIYTNSAEKMNTKIEETLVFEDALHCIITAKNSGFYTIGVYDESSKNDWQKINEISDLSISSFENLKRILEI